MIDRIYDTFIDEEELRVCDETTQKIFDELEPRPYSSRELLREFGRAILIARADPSVSRLYFV